jgi:hypothetical protein
MTYKISYVTSRAEVTDPPQEGATRTEYFGTEYEALHRARELVESGVHHGVSVCDANGAGDVLAGVRLQLKLGASPTD